MRTAYEPYFVPQYVPRTASLPQLYLQPTVLPFPLLVPCINAQVHLECHLPTSNVTISFQGVKLVPCNYGEAGFSLNSRTPRPKTVPLLSSLHKVSQKSSFFNHCSNSTQHQPEKTDREQIIVSPPSNLSLRALAGMGASKASSKCTTTLNFLPSLSTSNTKYSVPINSRQMNAENNNYHY